MSDVQEEIELALDHIDAALDDDETENLQNEWVLRKARQALLLELWSYTSYDD